ncbi:NAD-dependent epimerase/dehydratase family protein [bacterium]|uniref:Epimerase n=2 Tax=Katanobacteria TaxID=422282 RepID=A0A2M7X202_UNCKA|nr:NAD-dependent epimerase/dehydratase family protein [bacterium]PIP56323.1 MAG: epimerase [candidate division WWE3 bacterium CG22_combo_CG10-13_8_21_14_all_39_12]PJA40195.1 MAG: epimerase [candidate division WWE3 bacterium CG_4_9_14_3_um_filter_39_7]
MAQKVLITGGAGFLGINLTRFLLNKGYDVISYDLLPFNYPEKDKITEVIGDIRSKDDLLQAMEGVDFVVHTAAALPLYTPEEIYSTDIQGTRNVLESAKQLGVKRMVHVSSTAVYGIPDHHPLDENDKLDGVGPYGESKVKAEQMCEDFRKQGMCVPIVRPKSFIGPERLGVFALFYDWAKDGHGFPMIGSGNNRYQLLDVEDLCQAIYLTLTKPVEVANDTFNIGAEEFTTMKQDYQAVLDRAGFGKKITGFPAAPMIWTLRILERLGISPLYKWVYETASKDSFVSIEKAKRVLGYVPKFSNKDALIRNYEWYIQNQNQFEKSSGVTHRVPWKQGILGIVKYVF